MNMNKIICTMKHKVTKTEDSNAAVFSTNNIFYTGSDIMNNKQQLY